MWSFRFDYLGAWRVLPAKSSGGTTEKRLAAGCYIESAAISMVRCRLLCLPGGGLIINVRTSDPPAAGRSMTKKQCPPDVDAWGGDESWCDEIDEVAVGKYRLCICE